MAIDQSIFVRVPPPIEGQPGPFPSDNELLIKKGTQDKLFIGGHYYSDKSPVPALAMAVVYKAWRSLGGPSASERPDWFCRVMTWSSSGVAYLVAVVSIFLLGKTLGLSGWWPMVLAGSFGFGSVAIAYVQQVNNHILLLGVGAILWLGLLRWSRLSDSDTSARDCPSLVSGRSLTEKATEHPGPEDSGSSVRLRQPDNPPRLLSPRWLAGLGCLAGIGYTIDLGAGPLLAFTAGIAVVLFSWQNRGWTRRIVQPMIFALAALPWLCLHHGVNYDVGGTWKPANAVPEYLAWPGSPFNATNMTGSGIPHESFWKCLSYSFDLLVGKKGFLGHNLPLYLAMLMLPVLAWRRPGEWPILFAATLWALSTWFLYAITSTNASGGCCSVRWFVPLLIPGYLVLAVAIRDKIYCRADAIVLMVGGCMLAFSMTWVGPWWMRVVPGYWFIMAGTLLLWGGWRLAKWLRRSSKNQPQELKLNPRNAA
jgi:hypothetical protein